MAVRDSYEQVELEAAACASHMANRAYCIALGDESQPPWSQAPAWQRDSARLGVQGVIAGNTPEESHASWLAEKQRTGWRYGPVKDAKRLTHPCFAPYAELSEEQRKKDDIFVTTVREILCI